jgi:hypothetical protein
MPPPPPQQQQQQHSHKCMCQGDVMGSGGVRAGILLCVLVACWECAQPVLTLHAGAGRCSKQQLQQHHIAKHMCQGNVRVCGGVSAGIPQCTNREVVAREMRFWS